MKSSLGTALVALAFCGLSACTSVRPIYLADGQPAYEISCDFASDGEQACRRKAGSICGPLGYRFFDWTGHVLPVVDTSAMGDTSAADVGTVGLTQHTVLIGCRPPPLP